MSSKISLVIAAFIVGAGALLYYAAGQPRSVPASGPENDTISTTTELLSTEGWKTCRNVEYGYELKYPPEWHTFIQNPKPPHSVDSSCQSVGNILLGPLPFAESSVVSILVLLSTARLNGVEFDGADVPDNYYAHVREYLQTEQPLDEFILDGERAAWTRDTETNREQIVVYHNSRVYIISPTTYRGTNVMDAIISSFRFID